MGGEVFPCIVRFLLFLMGVLCPTVLSVPGLLSGFCFFSFSCKWDCWNIKKTKLMKHPWFERPVSV